MDNTTRNFPDTLAHFEGGRFVTKNMFTIQHFGSIVIFMQNNNPTVVRYLLNEHFPPKRDHCATRQALPFTFFE
jgi:hypothetical protein